MDYDAQFIKMNRRLNALEEGRPVPVSVAPASQDVSDVRAFMTRVEPLLDRVEAMLEDYEAYKATALRDGRDQVPDAPAGMTGAAPIERDPMTYGHGVGGVASAEPVGLQPGSVDAGITGSQTGPLGVGGPVNVQIRDVETGELFPGSGAAAPSRIREPDEAYAQRLLPAAATDQERSEIMLATGSELDQIGTRHGIARYG